MALRNYLYCPHTRCVHLSDPSALKNCQLYKEKGIGTLRKIQDRRSGEGKRERERKQRHWESPSHVAHGPDSVRPMQKAFRKVTLRWRQKRCRFRLCSSSTKV